MDQPSEQQIEFVRGKISANKNFFRVKGLHGKRVWAIVRLITILGGGLITVLLGLRSVPWIGVPQDFVSDVALFLSALLTILAAVDATFDLQWSWVNYNLTLTKIYGLEDEFEYLVAAGSITQEQLDSIFRQLQKALADINSNWLKRRLRDVGRNPDSRKS